MFPLIVYADGKAGSWTLSPGYSLLNEMTNVRSIFKYNLKSRLYTMSQKASSFCSEISTQQSHSQSLDLLNIFARFLLKLISHSGPSWLPLWYFFLFSGQPKYLEDLFRCINTFILYSIYMQRLHFPIKVGRWEAEDQIICNMSYQYTKYFLPYFLCHRKKRKRREGRERERGNNIL